MEKKDFRVSDAIPERPASFDDAVERTLADVTKKEQQKETPTRTWKTELGTGRKRGSKRSVLDIVGIAAIFVICVAAIGAVIGVRSRLNRTAPAAELLAEQPTAPVYAHTVYVSTVDELLAALAPDTTIVLADGTYNLTEASDYGTEGGQYYSWEDRSDDWFRTPEENSFELCLKNLENCRITGSRNAEIVTVPRTAAVLSARYCSGLVLSGFTAGHTVMADPCEGEVIRLVECPDAWVEDCSLYGCGTWGVNAVDCDDLVVTGCDIHECSSGGVVFIRCRDTLMTGCTVRGCGYRDNAFSLFYVYDCKNLRITACDVYENRTDNVFNLSEDEIKAEGESVYFLGTSVHDNDVLEQVFYSNFEIGPVVEGCEFKNNGGALLSDGQFVYDRDGNKLYEADLLAMRLDRTVDVELEALPPREPKTPEPEEPTQEPQEAQQYSMSYYLVDNVPVYPYESFLWESTPDFNADGESIEHLLKNDEVRRGIPEAEYDANVPFEIVLGDGWTLDEITVYNDANERIATVGCGDLPLTEHGCVDPDCVTTLSPGVYYVSAIVANRGEQISSGNEIVICLRVKEASEATEPVVDDPVVPLVQDPTAFPGLFRFWDYDEENGYREAPAEGVLFVCDFDGDGTAEEISYQRNGSSVTFSAGKASIDVAYGAGLEQAILLDLDPDSPRLNLLVICNTGSEDYETAELHMENGRFVAGPVIFAYCNYDDGILYGSATQTDILGTRWGGRAYHGEDLTPDSEWFDCDVIPDYIPTARDRESLIENGKLLHVIRDLPCTIDGEAAVIPADSYIYMTRWHESGTFAEIRTEDGTVTALVTVEKADPNDPEQYGYLIDGEMQDTYFDNIFYAD